MISKLTIEIEKEIIKLFDKNNPVLPDYELGKRLPRFASEEIQETLIRLVDDGKLFYSHGDYSNKPFPKGNDFVNYFF